MDNTTLISVIIPAYNSEEYMEQCIQNLLFQTFKNLEIIVVDDGSTDKTAQIAQQYSTVKYIYQPNSGVSVARNKGIDIANGEYLHFMDVDDLISLDFYEKMIRAAINTQSDMACCGFVFERFPSQSQKVKQSLLVSTIDDKMMVTNVCNYGACWKYIYRTSFLRKNGIYFEAGRFSGGDRIFTLQAVYHANKIVSVPEVMYIYKNRKESITTTKRLEKVKNRRVNRKYTRQYQVDFAKRNNFSLCQNPDSQCWQYKFLGLPLLTKRVYHNGKIKWYFLKIAVFQKKEIDRW